MRKSLFVLLLAAAFFCSAVEFSVSLFYNGKPLPGFQAVRDNAIALNAQFGQWGASQIPLNRGAGEYVVKVEIVAPGAESSSGGFYLLYADGSQKQLSYGHRGGKTPQTLTFKFRSEKPVKALLLKKMEKKNAPSVAVRSVKVQYKAAEKQQEETFKLGNVYEFQIDKLTTSLKCRAAADGKKGAAIPGNYPRYSMNVVRLGKNFPAGSYELVVDFICPAREAAKIAIYAGGAKQQQQLTQPFSAYRPGIQKKTCRFTALAPFNSLVVKKMDQAQQDSIGMGDFKLTMVKELRRSALVEITRYPAPFGIRLNNATALLDGKNGNVAMEMWLDHAAGLADAAGELYMLDLTMQGELDCSAGKAQLERLKAMLGSGNTGDFKKAYPAFRKSVEELHARANKLRNGEVLAEYGRDLWGHVKSFNHILHVPHPEYVEPTPYRLAGNGFALRFIKPGVKVDLVSTRNSNIYNAPDARYVFSSLTPVMMIDLKGNTLFADHLSGSLDVKKLNRNIWQIRKNFILIGLGNIQNAEVSDGKLNIKISRPGRLGFLALPHGADAVKTGEFYLKHLSTLPTEVLTLQQGRKVTLKAVTADGRLASFIPVPPLVRISQKSPYKVEYSGAKLTPDDREVFLGKSFSYTVPVRPVRTDNGINIFNIKNKPEIFRLLKKEGCDTIRLVIQQTGTLEEQKANMLHNLKLASEAGLKIGIDNHEAFQIPKELLPIDSPAAVEHFLKIWLDFIEAAKPYRKYIAWYDLLNEPHFFAPPAANAKPYWNMVKKVVPEMRKADPATPILVEFANMANAVGAKEWEDPRTSNIIAGWHDYWPHMFTHQRVQEGGSEAMCRVSYPAFIPMISWVSPSWRNESSCWLYWDRHKKDGLIYDTLELLARTGLPGDCGEYGVVGYSGYMEYSGRIWMRDSVRMLRRLGVSHAVWGVHGGYVWNVPHCKDEMLKYWKEK